MVISFVYWLMGKGGAERVISSLANDFANRSGTKVNVIVVASGESAYELDEKISYIKLGLETNERKNAIVRMCTYLKSIRKALLDSHTDVVLAFDPELAGICYLSSFGIKITIVGAERANPYKARSGRRASFFIQLSKRLDGFIFQTRGASQFYPMKTRKMGIVIPNGISIDIPKDLPEISERKSAICTTGRLVKVKRYDLLIQAFKRVSEKYPEYTLDIYGDGPSKDEIKDMIFDCKLQDKVFLRGVVDDVAEVLCQHKVFVLSSDYEGMPNGLIEAMACGCACVSTNCDFGPNELIRDGENGQLVPIDDVSSLSEALDQLLSNTEMMSTYSYNSKMISLTHSASIINDRYYDYITSLGG